MICMFLIISRYSPTNFRENKVLPIREKNVHEMKTVLLHSGIVPIMIEHTYLMRSVCQIFEHNSNMILMLIKCNFFKIHVN